MIYIFKNKHDLGARIYLDAPSKEIALKRIKEMVKGTVLPPTGWIEMKES